MNLNHPTDLLPGFALGCLDRPQVEKVRRHLHNCPICQAEVAGFQTVVEQMTFEPPLQPPGKTRRRRPPHRLAEVVFTKPWLLPVMVMVVVITIAALSISTIMFWQKAMHLETVALNQPRLIEFQALSGAPGASGAMLVERNARQGLLVVRDMPPLGEGMQYQLWLRDSGRLISGGLFTVSPHGDGRLELLPDKPLEDFDSFSITIEPYGGSPWPTGSKILRALPHR